MWQDYPSSTFRENLQLTPGDPYLPSSHPAAKYKWDKEYVPWEGGVKKDEQAQKEEMASSTVGDALVDITISPETVKTDVVGEGKTSEKEVFEERIICLPMAEIAT